jgi:hypothetical protein
MFIIYTNVFPNFLHHRFLYDIKFSLEKIHECRSQWPRRLRRRSAAERLLGPRLRIPPGAWMFVFCARLWCQVEVSATGRSLVQRSPTECGVCLSVIK